ncbi:hypothetical protein ABFS82_14G273400 [Erythranthe guttata]
MISLETPKKILSNKRKWDDDDDDPPQKIKSQSRSPLEWQQCLDIKSGQIYFYNTRTNIKRATLEGYNSNSNSNNNTAAPLSLELELNLRPCNESVGKKNDSIYNSKDGFKKSSTGPTGRPSWLAFEGNEEEEEEEMVTAVCRKCYMLVMMCKSTPSCPNCKFMHPTPEPVSHAFNHSTT